MAKAYWISTYRSISNPDALAAYAKLAGPAITAAGGRILARGVPRRSMRPAFSSARCLSSLTAWKRLGPRMTVRPIKKRWPRSPAEPIGRFASSKGCRCALRVGAAAAPGTVDRLGYAALRRKGRLSG